jgi:hypothetical protein
VRGPNDIPSDPYIFKEGFSSGSRFFLLRTLDISPGIKEHREFTLARGVCGQYQLCISHSSRQLDFRCCGLVTDRVRNGLGSH